MDKNNINDQINLINDTIIDTRFVLDDAKPFKGIFKTLLIWSVSYFIINMILMTISYLAFHYAWFEFPAYSSFSQFFRIIMYVIPTILYMIFLKKIHMTLKEIKFLKTFFAIPAFISLFRILYPISYYLNTEFLMMIIDTIPLDIIFMTFGLIQLYSYFKDKKLAIPIVLSFIYIIFFSIIKIICHAQQEFTPFLATVAQIQNVLTPVTNYSIFLSAMIFISLYFIWKDNHEQKHS